MKARNPMRAAVLMLATSYGVGCAAGEPDAGPDVLAIENVSVISMAGPEVLLGQTVLVRDGWITEVGPSQEVDPPSDATVVDGTGRFIIPGLSDMHAHVASEAQLLLYVAHGVTRIRNMWGSHTALAFRARSDSGVIVAPRILTAGRLVDGRPPLWGENSASVTDPDVAKAILDEERDAGFDFMKVYETLSAEVFDTIAAHAARIGHPFAGHVPRSVPLERAMRSGMQTIEHNSGWTAATQVYRPRGPDEGREVLQSIARGDVGWERLHDLDRMRELAELAAEVEVWHVPTLTWFSGAYVSRREAPGRFAGYGMQFMPPRILAAWDPAANPGLSRLSDETLEAFQTLLEIEQIRTKALHDAGAPLLLGTDTPNPFVPTGAAVHEELALLVQAGLSPFEALRTGTAAVGEFLSDSTVGTIAAGRSADLVLLEGNPLDDIQTTREISGVVLRGRWYTRDSLDALLQRAVASYERPDEWFDGAGPTSDGSSIQYVIRIDSLEIGAERITEEVLADATFTQGLRSTFAAMGVQVRESARVEEVTGGTVRGLTYRQATTAGTAEIQLRRQGDRVTVRGRTVDGQAIDGMQTLEEGAILTCPLVACLQTVVPDVLDLDVGERRALSLWTVVAAAGSLGNPSGNPRLVAETWEVTRSPDSGAVRVFDVGIQRNNVQWTLALGVDGSGLVSVSRPDGPGRYAAERR